MFFKSAVLAIVVAMVVTSATATPLLISNYNESQVSEFALLTPPLEVPLNLAKDS